MDVRPSRLILAATTGYRLNSNRDLVPGGGSDGAEKQIVEAAKGGKSDPPGPRKRPATGPATR